MIQNLNRNSSSRKSDFRKSTSTSKCLKRWGTLVFLGWAPGLFLVSLHQWLAHFFKAVRVDWQKRFSPKERRDLKLSPLQPVPSPPYSFISPWLGPKVMSRSKIFNQSFMSVRRFLFFRSFVLSDPRHPGQVKLLVQGVCLQLRQEFLGTRWLNWGMEIT